MQKQVIQSPRVPRPQSSYSQAILTESRRLLFLSGQVPVDAEGQLVGEGDFAEQARQVFRNLAAELEAAGATFANVVKLTIYLKDIGDYPTFCRVREEFLTPDYPASTLVAVRDLVRPEWSVEVEAMAALD